MILISGDDVVLKNPAGLASLAFSEETAGVDFEKVNPGLRGDAEDPGTTVAEVLVGRLSVVGLLLVCAGATALIVVVVVFPTLPTLFVNVGDDVGVVSDSVDPTVVLELELHIPRE